MGSRQWFTSWGWTYRPVAWPGFLVLATALAFCAQVFVAVDRHAHSVSDSLYGFFPYLVCCLVVVHWVAGHTAVNRR